MMYAKVFSSVLTILIADAQCGLANDFSNASQPSLLIRRGCNSRFQESKNGASGATSYSVTYDDFMEDEAHFVEAEWSDFRLFNQSSISEGADLMTEDAMLVTVKGFPLIGGYRIHSSRKAKVVLRPACKVRVQDFESDWRALEVNNLPEGIRRHITRHDLRPRATQIPIRNPLPITMTSATIPSTEYSILGNNDGEILAVAQEMFICPNSHKQYVVVRVKLASWRQKLYMLWDHDWLALTDVHRVVIALLLLLSNIFTFGGRREE